MATTTDQNRNGQVDIDKLAAEIQAGQSSQNIELDISSLLGDGVTAPSKQTPPDGQTKFFETFDTYEAADKGYKELLKHTKELEAKSKTLETTQQEYEKLQPIMQELQSNDDLMQELMKRAAARISGQSVATPTPTPVDFDADPQKAVEQIVENRVKQREADILQRADKLIQDRLTALISAQTQMADFMSKHPDLNMDKFKNVASVAQRDKISLEDAYTKFNGEIEQYAKELLQKQGYKLDAARTPTNQGGASGNVPRDLTSGSPATQDSWDTLMNLLNGNSPDKERFLSGMAELL